jgi:hypothetical protein
MDLKTRAVHELLRIGTNEILYKKYKERRQGCCKIFMLWRELVYPEVEDTVKKCEVSHGRRDELTG